MSRRPLHPFALITPSPLAANATLQSVPHQESNYWTVLQPPRDPLLLCWCRGGVGRPGLGLGKVARAGSSPWHRNTLTAAPPRPRPCPPATPHSLLTILPARFPPPPPSLSPFFLHLSSPPQPPFHLHHNFLLAFLTPLPPYSITTEAKVISPRGKREREKNARNA